RGWDVPIRSPMASRFCSPMRRSTGRWQKLKNDHTSLTRKNMSNETTQNSNLVDALQWRGLIADSTDLDELREQLENPTAVYCGFDRAGDSLHAGHLVPLLLLRRFQLAGHKALALAGGATGINADPRDVGE